MQNFFIGSRSASTDWNSQPAIHFQIEQSEWTNLRAGRRDGVVSRPQGGEIPHSGDVRDTPLSYYIFDEIKIGIV